VGVGQHPQGGSEASSVGSIAFFQGSRATDSRGDESSPIGSASPVSQEQQLGADPVEAAVWSERSESSPDELEKREGRVHWGKEENLRLVSAWIKHSTDPVVGVDRRGDRYWKDVAAEYNMHAPNNREEVLLSARTIGKRLSLLLPSLMHAMTRKKGSMAVVNMMIKS